MPAMLNTTIVFLSSRFYVALIKTINLKEVEYKALIKVTMDLIKVMLPKCSYV